MFRGFSRADKGKDLKKGLALGCNVRRNGMLNGVKADQLVPGDIVHLEEVSE